MTGTEQRGEVHRPVLVSQGQAALAQFAHRKFFHGSFAARLVHFSSSAVAISRTVEILLFRRHPMDVLIFGKRIAPFR